jgi:dipeptidyl aminopeptidase/acylaminoacyl peptidase
MRRLFLLLVLGVSSVAAQAPTPTDIFLAPITMQAGRPVIGAAVNITSRAGYDNQPSFTPDGRAILFTSVREDAQADIYRYDVAAKTVTRVTNTPESEYSATVMPSGRRFSVIRVERDSTQRLWSFALDGTDPRLVLEAIKPVGYHAWLDDNHLALFVLGSPNALVYATMNPPKYDTLTRRIGRSLSKLPTGPGFSFTQLVDSAQRVRSMTGPGATPRDLVSLPRGSQDLAWLPDGTLLVGSGSKMFSWQSGAIALADAGDLSSSGLRDITRLAVSPDGKWVAIVAVP